MTDIASTNTTPRSVVVTGAASGIGKACVEQLLADGYRVFALDRNTQDTISGQLTTVACDVGDEQSVAAAFEKIRQSVSSIEVLICSAGILRMGSLLDMSTEDFDAVFRVNTRGPWLCAKYAKTLLQVTARPGNPSKIVMLGSIASLRPKVGGGAYAASKAALSRIVRVMAVELGKEHILVNAIAPATVDTPMIQAALKPDSGLSYKASGVSPLGRVAQPADVVAAIKLLLSPGANYITGTLIPVDGGTSAAFVAPT